MSLERPAGDTRLPGQRSLRRVRADMDRGDMIGKVLLPVKVGAATHMEHMVRRAPPGLALAHTVRPPAGLPVRMHYEYFNLSQSGEV